MSAAAMGPGPVTARMKNDPLKNDPRYVSPTMLRVITWIMLAVGAVSAVVAIVLLVASVTGSPRTQDVPVQLTDGASTERATGYVAERATESGGDPGSSSATGAHTRQAGRSSFTAGNDGPVLSAADPTRPERLLNNGGAILLGATVAVGTLLLRPVLTSIAAGRPFGSGNSSRLNLLAAVTGSAAVLVPLLPQFAALLTLDRLGLFGTGSPFVMGLGLSLAPVVGLSVLLVVLAEAFRQGEKLHRDVEGLV
ncbi:DUF2975 domain-containing protein [Kineosporia sp. NBRC 101731]|uniref:DUF2975 domain-containing protein n=1 Tax=Kineosporia sp. NBRC 101731 TaxID=3032199 RepID=UPI0024A54019|nr:DUF2975 domain-containing protein [Kineosporia sp. NBRC 101731]GLY31771.1 hypothetical protein Kisp02_51360 [Kineosporia sp. NBRC 101731]